MFRLNSLENAIERAKDSRTKEQQAYANAISIERKEALDLWYQEGGNLLIDWTKDYYRTHNGQPLRWNDVFLTPFFLLLGNPWVEELVVQKPAQVGFSESLVAFCAFILTKLKSPMGLGFESQTKVRQMMGQRVQRAFGYCEPIQKLNKSLRTLTSSEDINSKETITVGGVSLNTFYSKIDDDQTAPTMRSFPANAIFIDEIGVCEPGIEKVAAARMEASDWKIRPFIRAGSTPGLEGGVVDLKIRTARYAFFWEVTCPCCNTTQFLDPFGNFLRWVMLEEDGILEERIVDQMGKPLSWYHHSVNPPGVKDWQLSSADRDAAIASAYIGCQDCQAELELQTRAAGHFRCKHTGELLVEFCDRLLQEGKPLRGTVAIDLPKLVSESFDAPVRLDFMFTTEHPAQAIQEFLGRAISLGSGKISLKRIQQCIGLTLLQPRKPDLMAAGIDQGKYSNWYAVGEVYWGKAADKKDRWRDSTIRIVEWGEFVGFDFLDELTRTHNLDLIGADNEPEYNSAVEYALKHLPRRTVPEVEIPIPRDRSGFNQVCEARVFDRGSIIPFEAYLLQYGWRYLNKREEQNPFYCAYYQIAPQAAGAAPVHSLDQLLTQNIAAVIALPKQLHEEWQKDYEPEIDPVSGMQVYLFDQVELKGGDQFRRNLRQVGNPGRTVRKAQQKQRLIPIYAIDRTYGLDAVRNRIYRQLLHLPPGTIYNPKDKSNFVYHLVTSDRLPEGKWVEPPGAPDHYHHCLNFLEMAVLCSLYEPGMKKSGHVSIPQEEFYGKSTY